MYEVKCGIYKITSPSNRIYIGQAVDIDRRIKEYEKVACKDQRRLYESLNKYGFKGHIIEVQELCEVEKLNERERYWQEFYDVLSRKGLNCRLTEFNEKSGRLSEETKSKIGASNKGKVRSEKVRQEMSERNKGKKLSEATKQKIREARARQVITNESRLKAVETRKERGNLIPNDETKQKMSESHKGQIVSAETRKKISSAHKGRVFSEEWKAKIKEAKQKNKKA